MKRRVKEHKKKQNQYVYCKFEARLLTIKVKTYAFISLEILINRKAHLLQIFYRSNKRSEF